MVRIGTKKHTPIHRHSKENIEKLKYNWRKFTTVLKHYSDLATSTIPESMPAYENPEGTENVNKLHSKGKTSVESSKYFMDVANNFSLTLE